METVIRKLIERARAGRDIVPLKSTFIRRLNIAVTGVEAVEYSVFPTDFRFFCNGRQVTRSLQEEQFVQFLRDYFTADELEGMMSQR